MFCDKLLLHVQTLPREQQKRNYNEVKHTPFRDSQRIVLEQGAYVLPTQATPFVGRWDELSRIVDRFADPGCRLINLVGPGGIGKTRIALEAARTVTDDFSDGVYFVALQPLVSPSLIVTAISETVELQFSPHGEPKEQLLAFLSGKTILLVLDNFEHLLDGTRLIGELLARAPHLKLLTTSRERLNIREEWVFAISGLSFPSINDTTQIEDYSAVQLFVQSAYRVAPQFSLADEAESVGRICRLLEGMPLAIELASSWAHVLSSAEIVQEIERGFDILETNMRDVPTRHRTMLAVLDQSWNMLSDTQRDVLKRLSVFQCGFTREAAQQVAGATPALLGVLIDKSWLRRHANGRYDSHELLRQYGEAQLGVGDQAQSVRNTHSEYYAEFLQRRWLPIRSTHQLSVLNDVDAEFENIRIAWGTMVRQQNAIQLSMSIYTLWWYSDLRGHYREALALFQQAEDELRSIPTNEAVQRAIGQLLTRRGWFYAYLRKLDDARLLTEDGLSILQQVGTPEDIALSLYSLSLIYACAENLVLLKKCGEQIAQIAQRTGNLWLSTACLLPLANAAILVNDLEEAKRVGDKFTTLAQTCGDLWLRAMSLSILQHYSFKHGNYVEARRLCEQGLIYLEAVGQARTAGDGYRELGTITCYIGDYAAAAQAYQRSLSILSFSGERDLTLMTLLEIAESWTAQRHLERTIELLFFVRHHPSSTRKTRAKAKRRLCQLGADLSSPVVANLETRAKSLQLEKVVRELIAELGRELTPAAAAVSQSLNELLTKRELEVLQLVAEGFPNRDIATRLFLTSGTVKWYLSEIYSKLGVSGRMRAVDHARTLKLL